MKNLKKLWIIGLMVLPGFAMTSANPSTITGKSANQVYNVQLAANETKDAQPAEEKKAEVQGTEAAAQPENKENKALFIVGALIMGLLMIIVIYKTRAIEK